MLHVTCCILVTNFARELSVFGPIRFFCVEMYRHQAPAPEKSPWCATVNWICLLLYFY